MHLPDSIRSRFRGGEPVEPHDTKDLPRVADAIHVGTGGDLTLLLEGGTRVCIKGMPGGHPVPWRVRRVLATGTTAGDLRAIHHGGS